MLIWWELLTTAYDDHCMKEKQACPPIASYKLHSASNIDVVNADQVGASDYSLGRPQHEGQAGVSTCSFLQAALDKQH